MIAITQSIPLHPRICDNYSPLLGCRDAPDVAIPGMEYGPSRQAYGSVVEGHKPFRLDHPAFDMISDYANDVLQSDISQASLPVLFRGFNSHPRFWGSKICSARSLELKHTTDGTTPRMVNIGRGRTVPVFFGITLQLQIVSAWHVGPEGEEEEAHMQNEQRRSWLLPLHLNTSTFDANKTYQELVDEGHGYEHPEGLTPAEEWSNRIPPRNPWVPTLWLAHRMDVSYDPSRSFSVQRHTWRTVGAGDEWEPADEAEIAIQMAATKSPSRQVTDETAGDEEATGETAGDEEATGETAGDEEATGETAGDEEATTDAVGDEEASTESMFDRLGLEESFRGMNESQIVVQLLLRDLCDCAGGRSGEDAHKVVGAGGTLWAGRNIFGSLLMDAPQEEVCLGAFNKSADGQAYLPEGADAEEAEADGHTHERLAKTQTWAMLKLDPACGATYPASRHANTLLSGTACPSHPEALGWSRRLPPLPARQPASATRRQRDTKITVGADGAVADVETPIQAMDAKNRQLASSARARLAEVLLGEAVALTSLPIMPDAASMIPPDAASAQVGADGDSETAPPQRKLGHPPYPAHVCRDGSNGRCGGGRIGSGNLRVMSFNAWNSNPPSWLYPNPADRWNRYSERMDIFADIILSTGPSIVGLQEIRLDITLGGRNQHGQMRHLAERLPGYQYVAQPATVYADANTMSPTRDEEGVAIISKHPIIASDYAVLSRDADDEQDEHARVCLHAVISVPDANIGLVDVYSVHMPLSPTARNRTTVEVARFIKASRLGAVQILLGDMNEEPQNASMQFWSGQAELQVPGLPSDSAIGVEQPFLDAWLQVHSEPEPRSQQQQLRDEAFSFPSDDPKKRIDTAFITSMPPTEPGLPDHRPHGKQSTIKVEDAWLVGQHAVPGSGNSSNPEHVGMVHPDSPLWPSDHRGVVFDLIINRA